jgi:hypothetical protein
MAAPGSDAIGALVPERRFERHQELMNAAE